MSWRPRKMQDTTESRLHLADVEALEPKVSELAAEISRVRRRNRFSELVAVALKAKRAT